MNLCLVICFFVLSIFIGTFSAEKTAQKNKPEVSPSVEYYTSPHHGITIPIMIHLDKPLLKKQFKQYIIKSRQKLRTVFRNVLKNVEIIFSHSSLNQTIHFVLLDVKILKNSTKKFSMDENVSKYLKSYCEWQGEKKALRQTLYYSVLFTGLDLYYVDKFGDQIRSSTGRGYMKGICSNKNSCTLLEWDPQNIAYIMAHELAHSLGISHDGPPYNECKGKRYIMEGRYNPQNPAKSWSPCNKRALQQFLSSKQAWCLRPGKIS